MVVILGGLLGCAEGAVGVVLLICLLLFLRQVFNTKTMKIIYVVFFTTLIDSFIYSFIHSIIHSLAFSCSVTLFVVCACSLAIVDYLGWVVGGC